MGYPNGVKGYRFIDPSIDKLFIKGSFHFEESPVHAPLETHVETFVPLPPPCISDNESTHSNHGSDLRSKYDLEDNEHADNEPQQMPKWAQSTIQEEGDLVGDLAYQRRMRSEFEQPPRALATTKPFIPMHCYMALASYP